MWLYFWCSSKLRKQHKGKLQLVRTVLYEISVAPNIFHTHISRSDRQGSA
jgi:hypothetical protein